MMVWLNGLPVKIPVIIRRNLHPSTGIKIVQQNRLVEVCGVFYPCHFEQSMGSSRTIVDFYAH